MLEVWKGIIGYEGRYEISNFGNVRSLCKSMITKLKPHKNGCGYSEVNLFKNRKQKRFRIHRLVGLAFVANPDNKPWINHIDCNRENPRADNLEWVTPKENVEHAMSLNRQYIALGEGNGKAKLTKEEVIKIKKEILSESSRSLAQIARQYGVDWTTVSCIKRGKSWKWLKVSNQ